MKKRRAAGNTDSTICRELTDLKAILNWAAKRDPPLIQFHFKGRPKESIRKNWWTAFERAGFRFPEAQRRVGQSERKMMGSYNGK
jgi:hypothetical protein